jgi:hypothetical protein
MHRRPELFHSVLFAAPPYRATPNFAEDMLHGDSKQRRTPHGPCLRYRCSMCPRSIAAPQQSQHHSMQPAHQACTVRATCSMHACMHGNASGRPGLLAFGRISERRRAHWPAVRRSAPVNAVRSRTAHRLWRLLRVGVLFWDAPLVSAAEHFSFPMCVSCILKPPFNSVVATRRNAINGRHYLVPVTREQWCVPSVPVLSRTLKRISPPLRNDVHSFARPSPPPSALRPAVCSPLWSHGS